MKVRNPLKNLNKFDWCLWLLSLAAVLVCFFAARGKDYATLASSLVGVTSLIFAAKGDAFGLALMLVFCLIYSFVSFFFRYYGETVIYLCMQFPVCTISLVSWIKNPNKRGSAEVKVGRLTRKYALVLGALTVIVTVAFYFILRAFSTQNLIVSTLSVATSFVALSLMAMRVPAYAVAFTLNDVVLIVLWSYAAAQSLDYLPMVACFSVFLVNDIYGFILWSLRKRRQAEEEREAAAQTNHNNG